RLEDGDDELARRIVVVDKDDLVKLRALDLRLDLGPRGRAGVDVAHRVASGAPSRQTRGRRAHRRARHPSPLAASSAAEKYGLTSRSWSRAVAGATRALRSARCGLAKSACAA